MILLILSFVLACSNKNDLPEGILPPPKMQEVMWDMIRAGEFLNGFVFSRDSSIDKPAVSQKWYIKIYQVHKISKTVFDKSYAYYQEHPLLMKSLMDSLSKKQVPFKPPVQISAPVKDSVIKKLTLPSIEQKKKIIDSLKRRRILKKRNFKVI
ncbi:MAG: DUF4296 domain-containing protein [Chitinophagaceae bacterium]